MSAQIFGNQVTYERFLARSNHAKTKGGFAPPGRTTQLNY
jgi:hypothetical protein